MTEGNPTGLPSNPIESTLATGLGPRLRDRLREEQQRRWRAGDSVQAEEYLGAYPLLRSDPEAALDLIYGEVLLREERGERPTLEEYMARFPAWTDLLRRQFELHRALHADDPAVAPAKTEFLGGGTTFQPASDRPSGSPRPPPCGSSDYPFLSPPQLADELGRLGAYRVLRKLGKGGMGVVYLAEDPRLERRVALKVMSPALADTDTARRRFLREAKAAAAVTHDHIITVYEVSETPEGVLYLAMPYLEGETLEERLRRDSTLPVAEVLRLGGELAEGLAAAHERGLIHRDIKPANVWLERLPGEPSDSSPRCRVKILDFGLVRSLAAGAEQSLSEPGAIVGTPAYMAPEQVRGEPVDARADLFSLGCVLYRASTGEPPFRGTDLLALVTALVVDQPRPPHEVNPQVPAELGRLIEQLLAKLPEDRPGMAADVSRRLAALSGTGPRSRPARRRWLAGGAALLGLLGLTGLVLALLRLPEHPPRAPADPPAEPKVAPGKAPNGAPRPLPEVVNSLGMRLAVIPPGRFLMGSPDSEKGGTAQERPRHEVTITRAFELGVHEVTVAEFGTFVGATGYRTEAEKNGGGVRLGPKGTGEYRPGTDWRNPGFKQTAEHPVVCVSWDDALAFCSWLGRKEGRTYRLPTEAEWEYACRAGTTTRFSSGDEEGGLKEVANLADTTLRKLYPALVWASSWDDGYPFTAPVGQFRPNEFGLHDMHGNVWEWCADWYDKDYYKNSPPQDPQGPARGKSRVVRGGAWSFGPQFCRAACRSGVYEPPERDSRLGFRVVRER